jgi:hypothetical protein
MFAPKAGLRRPGDSRYRSEDFEDMIRRQITGFPGNRQLGLLRDRAAGKNGG